MKKCQIKGCGLDAQPNSDKCILHDNSMDKNVEHFNSALKEYLEKGSSNFIQLRGIIFPKEYPISFELLGCNWDTLSILKCTFGRLIIAGTKKKSIIISDSEVDVLDFNNIGCDKITIYGFSASTINVTGGNVDQFLILSSAKDKKLTSVFFIGASFGRLQINELNTNDFHIASSVIDDLLLKTIKCNYFIVRDSVLNNLFFLLEIKSKKGFILCRDIFKEPRLSKVVDSYLVHSGFSGTDVHDINFIGNQWYNKKMLLSKETIELLDERIAKENDFKFIPAPYGKVSFDQCAETYRQLKTNYERKGNYIDAGAFHAGEMRMRRLALGRVGRYLSFNFFYNILSGYGERPDLALLVFILVFIALATSQLLCGFHLHGIDVNYSIQAKLDFPTVNEILAAARLTFSNMFFRSVSWLTPNDNYLNSVLWFFEVIFGPFQIALIILAIRRKTRR